MDPDPGAEITVERAEQAFRAATRNHAMPPRWFLAGVPGRLAMIRLLVRDCELRDQTQRSSRAWERGEKAAKELRRALTAWLAVGGEVSVTLADKSTFRIRPGGVWKGETHECLVHLADALDAAMPILEKRFSPARHTGRLNDPRYVAIIHLADIFAYAQTAGSASASLPGRAADSPLVRFIQETLPLVGITYPCEREAISQTLKRHWHGPPD